MKQDETKKLLQLGTIRTVSREGLEKTSTKLIAYEANVNEVFIFRYYGGKESLLDETFRNLDELLVDEVCRYIDQEKTGRGFGEEEIRNVLSHMWDYLMDHEDDVRFFVRYFYSAGFRKEAMERRRQEITRIRDRVAELFPTPEMASVAVHQVTGSMMGMVNQILNAEKEGEWELRRYAIDSNVQLFLCFRRQEERTEHPDLRSAVTAAR